MLFSPLSFCLSFLTILATTTLACGPLSAPSGSSFCATQSCKLTLRYIFLATTAAWLHISIALCWKKLLPIVVVNLTVFLVITTSLLPHQHWGKLEVEGFLEEGGQEQSSTTGCCSCSERWPRPRGSPRASVEQLGLPADWQPGQKYLRLLIIFVVGYGSNISDNLVNITWGYHHWQAGQYYLNILWKAPACPVLRWGRTPSFPSLLSTWQIKKKISK